MSIKIHHGLLDSELVSEAEIASRNDLFVSFEWFKKFEQHIPLSQGHSIAIEQSDANGGRLLLPLFECAGKGFLKPRTLRSLSNYYSPYFRYCELTPAQTDIQSLVINAESFFRDYDRIDLLPLHETEASEWRDGLANIGFSSHIYQHTVNWYHDEIKDTDDYWKRRPSRLVNTLKRRAEKLRKEGGYEFHIVEPKTELELLKWLADYHNVYFDSWKQIEPHPGFIDSICIHAWRNNQLRLGLAYYGELPVAGQIWFVCGDTANIFKLAHRRSFSEKSVGTLLTAKLVDFVLENDKVNCIDFLTGDDDYKKDWMTKKRPLFGIQSCNKKTLHGLVSSAHNWASRARQKFRAG